MSVIVTAQAMKDYRRALSKLSQGAADNLVDYMQNHNYEIDDDFIDFAHTISTLFGEAAGELACQMYDFLHEYWKSIKETGQIIYPAIPAEVPSRSEVESAVYGTLKTSSKEIPGAVARLVKRTAEDTTLNNAIRDGAEWAWIPAGDTCAFCLTLASRDWQSQSKDALKNGHAEHIHSNCDCTYVVRFDSTMNVEGYDPKAYYQLYKDGANAPYVNENIEHPQPKQQSKRNINGLRRLMANDKKIGKYIREITVD